MDKPVNNYWKNCGKDEKTLDSNNLSTSYKNEKTRISNPKSELSTYQQVLLR